MAGRLRIAFNIPAPLTSDPQSDTKDPHATAREQTVDRQTFDRLMLEHLPAAHRLAIRLTGEQGGAEEIVQEAMLRASRRWESFRGQAKFTTWLFQIVINVFRDGLRKRSVGRRRCRRSWPTPARRTRRKSSAGMSWASSWRGTSSGCRRGSGRCSCCVAFEQMRPSEAAAVLGISEQSARTNLHFARQTLKRQSGGLPRRGPV